MKSITVPRIEGLEKMDFDGLAAAMERGAVRQGVDCVNWGEYPYCPIVSFDAAADATHLFVRFFVRGLGLRAAFAEDNAPVWQDSCVEVFIGAPEGEGYFNFEMNCIGAVLAARRRSRNEGVEHFAPAEMARIVRHASLERIPFDERGGMSEWSVAIGIPFALLGCAGGTRPSSLRANFYKCADGTSLPHYVSWNPISTPSPDFHRPEFFGELLLA